ncbi:rod shape-determining protein [Actinomadura livida]|uniref:Actin-like ATPase involved in cell morphogenesis n=1 Tax=Actinomadura livida TaxID=79909 RepID=A0A7W7IE26_9ACTN|nr:MULTISPECIES: rod shape-determining protein [Actinomadura]MBB4775382.1 actin-like ATPase involved in cell morphogenesis [Actinomadura catellatispora]GGT89943.1 rod shape-determining protein [Actinomadura livida]
MRTTASPGPHAAIDLGTSRIRASVPARAVFVDRPSAVTGPVPATSPGTAPGRAERARPIEHGMVIDAGACTRLARLTLLEADPGHELRQVLIAVPAAANGTQQSRAVTAVGAAADRPVRTMQAPLAAAIGAGIDSADPRPRLILDIGAGIVETAVIMRGRVHAARSVQYVPERPAGHRMPRLPEHVREQVATALRHMLTDLPGPLRHTARAGGLLLTGGGACLPSLPGRLTTEMGLTISVARDPARATIRGLAHTCRSPALWRLTRA